MNNLEWPKGMTSELQKFGGPGIWGLVRSITLMLPIDRPGILTCSFGTHLYKEISASIYRYIYNLLKSKEFYKFFTNFKIFINNLGCYFDQHF
jgi:hypothetical protein